MTKEDRLIKKAEKAKYDKQYYVDNIVDKKIHNSLYYKEHKLEIAKMCRRYNKKNHISVCVAKFKWKKENKEKVSESGKKYYKANKYKILLRQNNMRANNIQYRLRGNLRSRLRVALFGKVKVGSAVKDLGCSIDDLKLHLEKQFYTRKHTNEKMCWGNYGLYGWHIDHIMPLCKFDLTDIGQLSEACHYTNLQPLWVEDNLEKGSK